MSEMMTYPAAQLVFELEAFDGPLDLLLYLIRKEEVDIYDIPIAEITRQYLSYLEACRELDLEVAGEFLYMAAMLIRIKAQMLLPRPESVEEIEDPRTELVNALLEYKRIKQAASMLEEMAHSQGMRYPRLDSPVADLPRMEPELIRVDIAGLMIAFGDLLRRAPRESLYEVRPQEINIEMRRQHILLLMEDRSFVEFDELFADDPRKIVMVVTFIAVLELIKSGVLRVEQATRFSPIRLFSCNSAGRGEMEDAALLETE
jgi:segregation and condensation protein A